MVSDTLSLYADLVMSVIVGSDLLPQIQSLQEAAMGMLCLQLKQFTDCKEHRFCV